MKVLRATRMERCIGCYSCSLACARLVHKRLSWQTAGIRIASSGGLSTGFEAKVCLACHPAPCAEACPTGSLRQRKGGGIIQKRDLCIRCGACQKACPVDAVYLDELTQPFICLHCGQCVPFCPHSCLEMQDVTGDGRTVDKEMLEDVPGRALAPTDVVPAPLETDVTPQAAAGGAKSAERVAHAGEEHMSGEQADNEQAGKGASS